jgi:hypothetical protein
MSDLRCQRCRYELRGLDVRRDIIQCPECGGLTDLKVLARDLVAAKRRRRSVAADVTIMIVLALGMILLGAVFDEFAAAAALGERLAFLATKNGLGVALATALLVFILSLPVWCELPRLDRVCFALGTACLLIVVPMPWSAPLLVAWIVGFHAWSVRCMIPGAWRP